MSKDIFREIEDGEDCTDILVKVIIALALAGAIFVLLIAGVSMYDDATRVDPVSVYGNQIRQYEADPQWVAEQKRLALKHGPDRPIFYEPDHTPWYWCGPDNNQKCRLQ